MGIILSILVTAISYMTIPLIYAAVTEETDNEKKLKTVTIITCVVVQIIYIALESGSAHVTNTAAAVFYGYLSIFFGKKIFAKRKNESTATNNYVEKKSVDTASQINHATPVKVAVKEESAPEKKTVSLSPSSQNTVVKTQSGMPVNIRTDTYPLKRETVDLTDNIENVEEPDMAEERLSKRLKRAFIFIEDGDFTRADEYLEEVLEDNPTCALAYVGKMMIELKIEGVEELHKYIGNIEDNKNYKRAIRYADDDLRIKLEAISKIINVNTTYVLAQLKFKTAITPEEVKACLILFNAVKDFYDVEEEINTLTHRNSEEAERMYRMASSLYYSSTTVNVIDRVIDDFDKLYGYKDSDVMAKASRLKRKYIEIRDSYHCPKCGRKIYMPSVGCSSCSWTIIDQAKEEMSNKQTV